MLSEYYGSIGVPLDLYVHFTTVQGANAAHLDSQPADLSE